MPFLYRETAKSTGIFIKSVNCLNSKAWSLFVVIILSNIFYVADSQIHVAFSVSIDHYWSYPLKYNLSIDATVADIFYRLWEGKVGLLVYVSLPHYSCA